MVSQFIHWCLFSADSNFLGRCKSEWLFTPCLQDAQRFLYCQRDHVAEHKLWSQMAACTIHTGKCEGDFLVQANLGFAAQYAATNTDPITNLTSHLADPTHINFTTNHVSLPFY